MCNFFTILGSALVGWLIIHSNEICNYFPTPIIYVVKCYTVDYSTIIKNGGNQYMLSTSNVKGQSIYKTDLMVWDMLEKVKEKSREREWVSAEGIWWCCRKKNERREEAKKVFEKIDLQKLLTLRNN